MAIRKTFGSTGERRRTIQLTGMYSFFPAIPDDGESGFSRPLIDPPTDEYINPRNWQAPKGATRELQPDKLRCLWDSLVEQVRAAGLVLGTYAEEPPRG